MIPRERDGKLVYCNQEDYHCQNIAIQQIEGPLFFASSQAVIKSLFRKDKEKAVILRMKQVRILDATGAHALKKIIDTCRTNQIGIIFSGVKPKVMDILEKSGIIKEIGADHVVETATEAIHLAFEKYVDRDICKACAKKMFKEC
ncbi:MAG: sodium-independent anion transporter [Candidatus Falkowbacteria bacterium]|nr:sodium-independent anion transporter [Candidatus Falkowbacteria bacterium]